MYFNGKVYFKFLHSGLYPGLTVIEPPKIEHSKILGDEYVIPGRNGSLFAQEADRYRSNATVTVKFALYKPSYESNYSDESSYHFTLQEVRRWLSGTGKLMLGDAYGVYYEVQKVEITTDEKTTVNYGIIEALFTVYPCEFKSTATVVDYQIGISNTYSFSLSTDFSEPLYKVQTGSSGGKVTINGKDITVAASETFYIDVRRRIAYSGTTNKSDKLSGDYADMVLNNGNNTITTDAGMTFTIVSSRDGYII